MTALKALANACWAAWNYTAPHPPEEAARLIAQHLDAAGFHIVPKGNQ